MVSVSPIDFPPLSSTPSIKSAYPPSFSQGSGPCSMPTDDQIPQHPATSDVDFGQATQPSFADKIKQRTGRPADVPAHDYTALNPSVEDDRPCLTISPAFHQRRVRSFQFAIHGRLFLRKGDSPRFAADLFHELSGLWNHVSPWEIIPLGKGYFTLKFSTQEDHSFVFSKTSWRLRTGILHLQAWVPKFNPNKAASTLAQVWLRIFNLPHDFWHPEVLTGIARHVGTPIVIDGCSARASVGYFARVLIEMNVANEIPEFLDVKCGDDIFEIEFGFENLPYFCWTCSAVGHCTENCRKNRTDTVPSLPTDAQGKQDHKRKNKRGRKPRGRPIVWRKTHSKVTDAVIGASRDTIEGGRSPIRSAPVDGTVTSNAFAILATEREDMDFSAAASEPTRPSTVQVTFSAAPSDAQQEQAADTRDQAMPPSTSISETRKEQPGSEEEDENLEVVFDEREHERTTSEPLAVQPLAVRPASKTVLVLTETPGIISRSRGRPRGATTRKGRVSDSSIKHRLRHLIKYGMSSDFQNAAGLAAGAILQGTVLDNPSPGEFLNKVQHTQSGGAIMQNFVIHSSASTDAARAISAVASSKKKIKWEDMLDDEDNGFCLDDDDPLNLFS